MKRVANYSEKELLAFMDDQLAKLIEIECMVEGVEPYSHGVTLSLYAPYHLRFIL